LFFWVKSCHIYSLFCVRYCYRSQLTPQLIFFYWIRPFPPLLLFTDSFRVTCGSCLPHIVTVSSKQYQLQHSPFNFSNRSITVTCISRLGCFSDSYRTMVPYSSYQHVTSGLNKLLKSHNCLFVMDRYTHWTDHSDLVCCVGCCTHVMNVPGNLDLLKHWHI
jgi:hypothetical protein